MNESAIQNLEYLRQLIAEVRGDNPYMDMLKLRMMQDTGMGVDQIVEES
jgi:hypothetical protein